MLTCARCMSRTTKGSTPYTSNLNVVRLMLKRRQDSATLRDCQGRTFLHVAVERKTQWLVLECVWSSELSSILNLQDNNGDTALHRAVHIGDLRIFASLVGNKHVRMDVAKKKGLTPLDVWWTRTPNTFHHLWVRVLEIVSMIKWT
jgi:ankyrin repeat protein